MVEGIIRTIPADAVHVASLAFGPIEREQLELPVLPRALLEADGFLGLDCIDGQAVTFDFKNESMRIAHPGAPPDFAIPSPEVATVSAHGAYGHLKSFDCRVDGVAATGFIDSGAQITIGNSALADAVRDRRGHDLDLGKVPISGVTGGSALARVISIETVRLGGLRFSTPIMAIADLQIFDIWGLKDTPALLIGMNYLRDFTQVTVDY